MSRQLGSLTVPIVASLPATGITGSILQYAGVIYSWDGAAWIPHWPLYIDSSPPVNPQASRYLWVNTSGGSGTDATLWVEDGIFTS